MDDAFFRDLPALSDTRPNVDGMDHLEAEKPARHVQISARGPRADIAIDGTRIEPTSVRAYTVSHVAGEHPEFVLHAADREDVQWAGLARIAVADLPDPGPAAAVFLSAIDPQALERAALARPDLGAEPGSLTKAMLTQLTEWARGL